MFERIQSTPAERIILNERVGGDALLPHGFPQGAYVQGAVCDQKEPPPA